MKYLSFDNFLSSFLLFSPFFPFFCLLGNACGPGFPSQTNLRYSPQSLLQPVPDDHHLAVQIHATVIRQIMTQTFLADAQVFGCVLLVYGRYAAKILVLTSSDKMDVDNLSFLLFHDDSSLYFCAKILNIYYME